MDTKQKELIYFLELTSHLVEIIHIDIEVSIISNPTRVSLSYIPLTSGADRKTFNLVSYEVDINIAIEKAQRLISFYKEH